MSYSHTKTSTSSFTITHARYLSSKVAADMHLCALYYGKPSEDKIRDYAEEVAQYLNEGYLSELSLFTASRVHKLRWGRQRAWVRKSKGLLARCSHVRITEIGYFA